MAKGKNRNKNKGIVADYPAAEGAIKRPAAPTDRVLWCFKYLDKNHKTFSLDGLPNGFGKKLLERFREFGRMPHGDLIKDKALHSHRVDIERVEAHGGFKGVDETLWQHRPWQIKIQNKMRAIGFLVGNVFHIVWIDKDHKFDPRK